MKKQSNTRIREPRKDTIRGGRDGCHAQINGLDLEKEKETLERDEIRREEEA